MADHRVSLDYQAGASHYDLHCLECGILAQMPISQYTEAQCYAHWHPQHPDDRNPPMEELLREHAAIVSAPSGGLITLTEAADILGYSGVNPTASVVSAIQRGALRTEPVDETAPRQPGNRRRLVYRSDVEALRDRRREALRERLEALDDR